MPYCWPDDTVLTRLACDVEDRWCHTCGGQLTVCDHRHRRLFTLKGPVHVVCKLAHCPTPACPAHSQTRSPEAETALAMPWWVLGWDVVCWLGHRRFARPWSVGQIRAAWADPSMIRRSDDAIERSIHRYQRMVAARQHDPQRLAAADADVDAGIVSINGLHPEQGHETLSVVRELARRRVWCAEALLSSTTAEVQPLLAQARSWAARLGKPVRLGMSEKHAAFVRGIAAEFPGGPHRYCAHHFLRDVAQPVLAADSHAKVQRRRKVRGVRTIERAVGATRRPAAPPAPAAAGGAGGAGPAGDGGPADVPPPDVVLDSCAAVRGILNEEQGGPLHPPGLRMAGAFAEVQASLQRHLEGHKGGLLTSISRVERTTLTAG